MTANTKQTTKTDSKACTNCGIDRPVGDYYADERSEDGRYSECKFCHIKRTVSGKKGVKNVAQQFLSNLDELWKIAVTSIAVPRCVNCSNQMAKANGASGRMYICRCVYHKITQDVMHAYSDSSSQCGP
jgi:hypothetical protein